MWNPLNSPITTENFNIDDILPDVTGQQIKGGSLRLIPSLSGARNYYTNWPLSPSWHLPVDFSYSGQATGYFSAETGSINNWVDSEGSWVISNNSGETGLLYLDSSTAYPLDAFENDFTLEISLSAESSSGFSALETGVRGLGLYVRTTGSHEYFEFHQSGVFAKYNSDLSFPLDLRTRKTVRFGLSGNDFYVFAQPSFSIYETNGWTEVPSLTGSPLISLGTPSGSSISGDLSNFSGKLEIDQFKFYSGFFELDRPYTQNTVYDTSQTFTYYTDSYQPNFSVQNWLSFEVKHDGGSLPSIETTTITPQYRNNGNSTWTNVTDFVMTLGASSPQIISLVSVPVIGNATDEIRFKIDQSTNTETVPPPAVDEIVLLCSSSLANLNIHPNWGSRKGKNLVHLRIDSDSYSVFPQATSGQYDSFLLSVSSVGDTFVDEIGNQGDVIGNVGTSTGIYFFGTEGSSVFINNSSFNEPYLPAGPLTTETGSSYLSGNPSGIAFGIYGEIATGDYSVYSGNAVDYNDLYLFKDYFYDDNGVLNYSQGIYTNLSGVGISIDLTGLSADTLYQFSCSTKIERGENIYCIHGTDYHEIDQRLYSENRNYSMMFTSTGTIDSIILASTGVSLFSVNNTSVISYTPSQIDVSGLSYDQFTFSGKGKNQFYIDSKVKLLSAPEEHSYLSNNTGSSDGYYLRINQDRKPEFFISLDKTYFYDSTGVSVTGDFEDVFLTGNFHLPLDEYFHVAAGISHSYYTGVVKGARAFIAYNGQVVASKEYDSLVDLSGFGEKITPILDEPTSDFTIGTGLFAEVDWIRIANYPQVNIETFGQKKAGFGKPYFQSDKWYRPGLETSIVLRSFNEDGALISDNPDHKSFNVLNPDGWITYTDLGSYGRINNFNSLYKGTCYTEVDSRLKNQIEDSTGSFSFLSWVTVGETSGVLFSLSDNIKEQPDSYFSFGYTQHNYPFIETKNAGSSEFLDLSGITPSEALSVGTDGLLVNSSEHFHLGFILDNGNYNIYYDGSLIHSGEFTLGNFLTGASGISDLYYCLSSFAATDKFFDCSLEETIFDTNVSYYSGNIATIANTAKTKSSCYDKIFINSLELTGGQIVHYDYKDKYIVMPSGSGIASVWGSCNYYIYDDQTGLQGWALYGDRPYKYLNDYSFDLSFSGIDKYFGSAKSPFKILSRVPEDSVNLSFITQPSFSTSSSLGLIDLSYETVENISNYLFGDFMITNPSTGSLGSSYSGSLDTKDFAIGATSVIRKDYSTPEPLYYSYLIGRDEYAVRAPENTLESLRDSISVVDSKGNDIFTEFPWDIVATGIGPNGSLTSGDFSVCLLTRYPFLADNTIWTIYNAVPYRSGDVIYGKREAIYPEPIFKENVDYSIAFRSGLWDLSISGVS